jgi:Uma2 family endonuclease
MVIGMSSQPRQNLSVQQYLEIERASETKHEFFRGQTFAMSGASRKHIVISGNIARWIHQQFDGRPCEVYQADMRVKVSETGLYTYPDVVAVCHDPKFEDAAVDTLLNPQVIIEVASKSTENYDRRVKFAHYKTLDSLTVYIMVSQEQPVVEPH